MISNWVDGRQKTAKKGLSFNKVDPHTGLTLYPVAASSKEDVEEAISSCAKAFSAWAALTTVKRGQILSDIVAALRANADELAALVADETGKTLKDAVGEVGGAIAQGDFFAGEGMRLYGRSLNSGVPHKYSHTVRQAHGVCGLIVPANTPIANIAWKVFPALICGNTAVLKASEDAPRLALRIGELATSAGLPDGVLNVIQGAGDPAGTTLVSDPRVSLISFTGSTAVGRAIAETAGRRLARVSLELGGKNPFVVCDDADLENAVEWASLSAFSNAGQRCSAGSRLLVADAIYEEFVGRLITKAESLKLGVDKDCDLGPVISRRQRDNILRAIERAKDEGGEILTGGGIPAEADLRDGFYIQPTIIAGLGSESSLATMEIFGPVASIQRFSDLSHAAEIANSSDYGLTAAIHTTNIDRAMWFAHQVRAGAVNINFATYGSEPHMPFGGFGASGNGTREPGVEALDVYSELKNISVLVRPKLI